MSKIIKLKEEENCEVFLNVEHIVFFYKNEGDTYTTIVVGASNFQQNLILKVEETPEKLTEMINNLV